jgi:phosphoglycerate dehydrogenase-like enzyme
LRQRRIAGAALDVFDIEPLPADHPFRSLEDG